MPQNGSGINDGHYVLQFSDDTSLCKNDADAILVLVWTARILYVPSKHASYSLSLRYFFFCNFAVCRLLSVSLFAGVVLHSCINLKLEIKVTVTGNDDGNH